MANNREGLPEKYTAFKPLHVVHVVMVGGGPPLVALDAPDCL